MHILVNIFIKNIDQNKASSTWALWKAQSEIFGSFAQINIAGSQKSNIFLIDENLQQIGFSSWRIAT